MYRDEQKNTKVHKIESHYGSFEKAIQIPENINEDGINASIKNGVLEVVIPKMEKEKKHVRQIEVSKK